MPVIATADKNSKPNGIDDKNMSIKKAPRRGMHVVKRYRRCCCLPDSGLADSDTTSYRHDMMRAASHSR